MEGPPQDDEVAAPSATDSSSSTGDGKTAAAKFKPVTLRKRLDWASPQLFQKCCQAAMDPKPNTGQPPKVIKDDQIQTDYSSGTIEVVTVEVCRPAGGEKVMAVKVIYKGVRITRYEISLDGPEPAENITFEFDSLKFVYNQTDAETGEVVDGSPGADTLDTGDLENAEDLNLASGNEPSGTENDSSDGASPSPAMAPAAAPGSPSAPGAAPDSTVTVNFPGLWQGTGFGVLPD